MALEFPGFIAPNSSPAPLEGAALWDFVQALIKGITGMVGPLVFPSYQPEPPNIPTDATAWASFNILTRPNDTFPYRKYDGVNQLDQMQRHERLNILASFYDNGSGGQADKLAALLRDGLWIPQNIDYLRQQGFAFVACDEPTPAPILVKMKWLYRVDLPFQLRRAIVREYATPNIVEVPGTITIENPNLTSSFDVVDEED